MAAVLARRSTEPRVFFPWEQRQGLRGAFGRRRLRVGVGVALAVLTLTMSYVSGERAAAIRATRATLTTTVQALSAYRSDHAGGCPRALNDLVGLGYLRESPVDAWGRGLRLECPGRQDPRGFDLSSDGPDGLPGGLDRVR